MDSDNPQCIKRLKGMVGYGTSKKKHIDQKPEKKNTENLQLWALKRNTLFGYIQWLFEKKHVAILETFVSWGIYVSLENGFPVDGDTLRRILT